MRWIGTSAALGLVLAALALAGCGPGANADRTTPVPPDRLDVTLTSEAGPSFSVALDCDVADRSTCAEILDAVADERDAQTCEPIADAGQRILVRGSIGGADVAVTIERRTDCEARLYERVREALSP